MKNLELIHGDARHIPLPDESVQCIVTSPPYWGLRKYAGEQELIWGGFPKIDMGSLAVIPCDHKWTDENISFTVAPGSEKQATNHGANGVTGICGICGICGAWRGAFGLEPTIEMYVAPTLEILRECRRVLRPDGVLFWNIGDSYAGSRAGPSKYPAQETSEEIKAIKARNRNVSRWGGGNNSDDSCKPKDLCLIPSRVAIAAQSDVSVRNGKEERWWVRSMIIWAKPNPMPESCTDRPTDAYEHILMLTKSERYFWDADAVREPAVSGELRATFRGGGAYTNNQSFDNSRIVPCDDAGLPKPTVTERNLRNVWNFATQPYSGAHFATFPEELPRRCILAATSAKGCCMQCGAPWERVTRRDPIPEDLYTGTSNPDDNFVNGFGSTGSRHGSGQKLQDWLNDHQPETIGWKPTCLCRGQHGKTVPCMVLDPFGGSGTTGRVALELRRRSVLVDIAYNAEYRGLAERRTSGVNVKLPFL